MVFIGALILIGVLVARKIPGGILIGMIVATIAAIIIQAFAKLGTVGDPVNPDPQGWNLSAPRPSQIVALPDFSLIGAFDLFGSFERIGVLAATMLVFTLVFTNFFDAMGTMTGLARSAGLQTKDGMFPASAAPSSSRVSARSPAAAPRRRRTRSSSIPPQASPRVHAPVSPRA